MSTLQDKGKYILNCFVILNDLKFLLRRDYWSTRADFDNNDNACHVIGVQ